MPGAFTFHAFHPKAELLLTDQAGLLARVLLNTFPSRFMRDSGMKIQQL